MKLTLDHVRALSTAPWFDDELVQELVAIAGGGDVAAVVGALRSAGVTIERGGASRVVEPLRSQYRKTLSHDNPVMYAKILGLFARRVLEGSNSLLDVLGRDGGQLSAHALAYIAARNDRTRVDNLVRYVQENDQRTESDTARSASKLLTAYLYQEDRMTEFLDGFGLWNEGRRTEALPHFHAVLQSPETDRATCVAAHLVGVGHYLEGDLQAAERSLNRAIAALRKLDDRDGLIHTLTTLGRVKREQFRLGKRRSAIEESVSALEEARELVGKRQGQLASVLQPLALAYLDSGQTERAFIAATQAAEWATPGNDRVAALVTLAMVTRAIGDDDGYGRAVDEATVEAEIHEVGRTELARLLNVRAGTERRRGNLRQAERLAIKSLAMGRRLHDQRHIAHSSHTLASVYVDQAASGEVPSASEEEITALIGDARRTLVRLKDARGVELVDNTVARWEGVRSAGFPASAEASPVEEVPAEEAAAEAAAAEAGPAESD